MRTLIVQFQPKRASSINVEAVVALFARVVGKIRSIRAFAYQKGNDRGPYINFQLEVPAARLFEAWSQIRAGALGHRTLGSSLRHSCIATCEGTHGWDNYLLLHHFDPKHKLDRLRDV
jgi:hypothetical protein